MAPSRAQASKKATAAAPSSASSFTASFFARPAPLYLSAIALRVVLLLYGLWQDANSPVKYTDIDYLVFTDAARFTAAGGSPYQRETYRYTPLLAWLLLPTAWTSPSPFWTTVYFSFGKIVFAVADLVAGWLIERVLTMRDQTAGGLTPLSARKFAAIWLLNPMVATISTRGSSEGLLGVLVIALLWAVLARRITLAALLLGFGVHFKIYPFIYAPAIVWWMDDEHLGNGGKSSRKKNANTSVTLFGAIRGFLTPARLQLAVLSLGTFVGLNILMVYMYDASPTLLCSLHPSLLTVIFRYGSPFLVHTYFHHVTRIDHRHNFSPYNIQLYIASAFPESSALRIESLAFLPQLLLSCVLIPLVLAKKDLPTAMLAQTFAFVAFNKVCTSQVRIAVVHSFPASRL